VPVLVIWGSDDEVAGCQDAMVKRLTGSKKVTRVVIQGAKHLTHMDHPDEWLSKFDISMRDDIGLMACRRGEEMAQRGDLGMAE